MSANRFYCYCGSGFQHEAELDEHIAAKAEDAVNTAGPSGIHRPAENDPFEGLDIKGEWYKGQRS